MGDWSFPSNHATLAGATAVALICVRRTWAWLGVILALATGQSRVYVGVHYPHDVLVGLLLGASVAAALPQAARKCEPLVDSARLHPAGELLLGPSEEVEPLRETARRRRHHPQHARGARRGIRTPDHPPARADASERPTDAQIPQVRTPEGPTARIPRER